MTDRFEDTNVKRLHEPTNEPRARRFRLGPDEYIAFSFVPVEIEAPPVLTASERCVFRAMLADQSNQAIATSRGRSVRTVANQVAAVFVKLGVGSRAELCAKYGVRSRAVAACASEFSRRGEPPR